MSLFQVLLGHSSWLVLHCTLAALQTFVEVCVCVCMLMGVGEKFWLTHTPTPKTYTWALHAHIVCICLFHTHTQSTQYTLAVEECIPGHLKDVVASYLHRVPYLSSERSELREVSFWVRELGARGEREGRWREGKRSNGDVTHTRQNLVHTHTHTHTNPL